MILMWLGCIGWWIGWWVGCHSSPPPSENTEPLNTTTPQNASTNSIIATVVPPIPKQEYFIGIPKGLLNNIEDPIKTHRLLQDNYGSHGWTVAIQEDNLTIQLNYQALFNNRPDLSKWTTYISKASSVDQRIRDYVHYVQNLTYTSPPVYIDNTLIGGYWTPSMVLENQAGDCDSLSMLLASLVAVEKVQMVLLHNSEENVQHMVVGIAIDPLEKELMTELDGQRYVVFDTTINHPPSQQQRDFLQRYNFEVIWLDPQ